MKKRIAVICIPQDKLTNGKYPQAQIFEVEIPDNRETFDPVEFRISQLMEVYTRAMNHTYFYAYCEEEGEAISQNCNFWSTYCDLSSQTALDYLKSNYKDEQLIEWGLLPQSANDSFLAMIEADRIEAEKKYQEITKAIITCSGKIGLTPYSLSVNHKFIDEFPSEEAAYRRCKTLGISDDFIIFDTPEEAERKLMEKNYIEEHYQQRSVDKYGFYND